MSERKTWNERRSTNLTLIRACHSLQKIGRRLIDRGSDGSPGFLKSDVTDKDFQQKESKKQRGIYYTVQREKGVSSGEHFLWSITGILSGPHSLRRFRLETIREIIEGLIFISINREAVLNG